MQKRDWRFRLPLGVAIYLAIAGALLIAGFIFHRTLREQRATGRFTILQINDVYKVEGIERETVGGLARVRALRKALEKEGQPVLMLHGGDFLSPSVMSDFLEARPMVRCLNLLDGDENGFDDRLVVTFGNHEFDNPSQDLLAARIAASDFRWVTSTILFRDPQGGAWQPPSQRFKNVSEDLVVDLDGIQVGIVALTVDGETRDWVDYRYGSRNRLVREALERLKRKGAQVLVALTHQDYEEDERLAKEFPEIDLIVGGHDHSHYQKRIGHTWITKADADAKSAVRLDVAVLEDGSVIASPYKVDLGPQAAKDLAMDAAIRQARDELEKVYEEKRGKKLDATFANTDVFLEGVEQAVRGRETALGNLLADSIRERMNTDVAFIHGGAIRINDNIPAGKPITQEDMEGIFHYSNNLVSFALSRNDLLNILRNSVSKADRSSGRFLQVSCIRFRYRADTKVDPPTYEVKEDDVWICPGRNPNAPVEQWVPLRQAPEPITASTLEFLWKSGHKDGYDLFDGGVRGPKPISPTQPPIDWRKEFEAAYVSQKKPVQKNVEERIQRVEI
jgi:5'-nucleotidase